MANEKYANLIKAIRSGNVDAGRAEASNLAKSGVKPETIFAECIEPELTLVGEDFSKLKIFLPEMVAAAAVAKGVQSELESFFDNNEQKTIKGKVVLATVSGDLHDIGKNIVKAMLEVNGFDVTDLGVDVATANIVKSAREVKADIIALSALMLPSLPFVEDTIELSKTGQNVDFGFKIMVGGGPVTQEWADKVGISYGNDAAEAVSVAQELMGAA